MNGLEEYALKRGLKVLKVYTTLGQTNTRWRSGPHLRAVVETENGKKMRLWYDPSPRPGRIAPRGWRTA